MGILKRNTISTEGGKFKIDYAEPDKIVYFSMTTIGKAAPKGTWTVIDPDIQCMIVSAHALLIQYAVEKSHTIPLVKKRGGAYWLPIAGCKS